MKQDYAYIHVILDRSGSMQDMRDDLVRGFNNYVEQQKQGFGFVGDDRKKEEK